LQDLVQDDAVEEAAQTEPQQDPRRDRKACSLEPVQTGHSSSRATGSDPVDRFSHLLRNGVMDHVACSWDDPQLCVVQRVRQPERLVFGINDAVGHRQL
jgi:hypothetical protein